jgi:hypothetical protein
MSPFRGQDEAGVTVAELTVVVLVFSLVSLMLFSFLDHTTLLTARADSGARADAETQLALRIATDDIRGALPVSQCVSDGVASPALPTTYADCITATVSRNTSGLDNCPRSVFVYAVVDYSGVRRLVQNRTDYTRSGGSCVSSAPRLRRVLLESVVNPSSAPVFTYYTRTGATIDPVANPAHVVKASSIKMSLHVNYRKNAPPLVLSSVIAPRNSR